MARLTPVTTTSASSIADTDQVTFNVVVVERSTFWVYAAYPTKVTDTRYTPLGKFLKIYLPLALVDVAVCKSGIETVAPGIVVPDALSVTMPVSVPVPLVTGGDLSIAFAAVDTKSSM